MLVTLLGDKKLIDNTTSPWSTTTDNLLLPTVTKNGDVSKLPNITNALPNTKSPVSLVSKSNCAVT